MPPASRKKSLLKRFLFRQIYIPLTAQILSASVSRGDRNGAAAQRQIRCVVAPPRENKKAVKKRNERQDIKTKSFRKFYFLTAL
jgi:hypothetical protein